MAVAGERLDGDVGHVVARHRGHAAVAGGPADRALGGEHRQHVEVEVVAQKRPARVARLQVLLGLEVLAAEQEPAIVAAPKNDV